MDKKEETSNPNSWESPKDDDHSPAEDYNDFTEDRKPNDRFDDAILNSNKIACSEKPKRKTFKEQWEETDEICASCNKVCKPAEGLNKQNIKRLLSFQTDIQSLTILFLLIMCGLFGFSTYTYMVNPVNCSNFTVLDNGAPVVYSYGDGVVAYNSDDLSNLSEMVYIHSGESPTPIIKYDIPQEDEYNITE